MKRFILSVATLFLCLMSFSQSLSPERVARIKAATVRILLNDTIPLGTGFVVSQDCLILTCTHVILPAVYNSNTTLTVEFQSGEKITVGIAEKIFSKVSLESMGYDLCILVPVKPESRKFTFLKLGNFDNCIEGQEVYTCGYPLGIKNQFISKGIISTKYLFAENAVLDSTGKKILFPRYQALADLTLNRGNSGGAIVKVGNRIEEDEVVGVASYIITPAGGLADSLINVFKDLKGGAEIAGINPNKMFGLYAEILAKTSIGVSGFVSINHFLSMWDKISK